MNTLQKYWASLPHQLQAGIVTFATAAGVTLARAVDDGSLPSTLAGAKHLLGTAIVSGVAALRLFYMLPNSTPKPPVK